MKQTFRLVHRQAREWASKACFEAPDGYCVTFAKKTRSLEQNAAQFPFLQGFAEQLLWPVNGIKTRITALEYKDILTAAYENDVNPRLAEGYEGGTVMLGRRTSEYDKEKFSEWLEWLKAAAALKGIEPVYKSKWGKECLN